MLHGSDEVYTPILVWSTGRAWIQETQKEAFIYCSGWLMSGPISNWTSQVYDTRYNQGFHQLGFQVSQRLVSSRTQQTLPTGPKKCRPLQQLPLTFLCTWKKKFSILQNFQYFTSPPKVYQTFKGSTNLQLFTKFPKFS